MTHPPSPAQFRGARAWLGLSRDQVAHAAGLHVMTVAKAERGDPTLTRESLEALISTYTARGFVFHGTSGIARRSPC